MTDGSTYLISLGMYGITIIGIIVFLFYANAIYIQLQMREIGVYLSLGLPPKSVPHLHNLQKFQNVIHKLPLLFLTYQFPYYHSIRQSNHTIRMRSSNRIMLDMLHTDKEKQAEIRSGILGFIFQDFMLIDGLTVQTETLL